MVSIFVIFHEYKHMHKYTILTDEIPILALFRCPVPNPTSIFFPLYLCHPSLSLTTLVGSSWEQLNVPYSVPISILTLAHTKFVCLYM